MASRDPAFLWETEVLRSSPRRNTSDSGADTTDWLPVREASEATGVPPSTIRKWARHGHIPSFLESNEDRDLRLVSMSGIKQRADDLGRVIEADQDAATGNEVPEPSMPEGTMLVPLDAWNRMLNQLGNLHEAGQQLAEARERAAKAETEARFLKERLAELREALETANRTEPEPDLEPPDVRSSQDRPSPTSLIRSIYRSWRSNRR